MKKINIKNIIKSVCAVVISVSMTAAYFVVPPKTEAKASVGAHTYSDANGNVFLGGNYIEIGLAKGGSFGTVNGNAHLLENFHSKWFYANSKASGNHGDSLGLIADGDGWDTGNDPIAGDFFVPGTPYEGWSLTYTIDGVEKVFCVADLAGSDKSTGTWKSAPVTHLIPGDLAAVTSAVTADDVYITITYSLGVDDLFFTTCFEIVNESGKELTDVYYTRDFDPDQDQWLNGTYATYNKVFATPDRKAEGSAENYALVVARGEK